MKKNLVMFTSVFASLAILSTGFAAWVISGGETKEETIGQVVVDTVTDNRHKMEVISADTENEGQIIFGRPETVSTGWLTNTDGPIEKLSTFFKVTVTKAANKKITDIITERTFVETSTNVYSAAKDAGFVGGVPEIEFVDSATKDAKTIENFITDDATEGSGIVYIRLQFSWGEHFETKNPYVFYNGKTMDDATAKDAFDSLTAMKSLANAKFKLTLKTE